jgi:vacuolar-type H+-ATPase subunit H
VPRVPSFLQRFRRLVTPPGRPAEAVGVPASGDELAGELGPVLEQLDTVGAEASDIEQRAREQARRRRDEAAREAAAILAEAHVRADAERARAAAEQRASGQRSAAAARADAAREVERIRAMRDDRVEQLVDEVVECARLSAR